jgi:TolA-binding protein
VIGIAFGVPLAAVLAGSVAWAATNQGLVNFVERVSAAVFRGNRRLAQPAHAAASHRERLQTNLESTNAEPARGLASVALPSAASLEPVPVAAASQNLQVKNSLLSERRVPAVASTDDGEITKRELLLYENAHRAHFVDKNWTAALSAWDEYLRGVPNGRFAVEARYNRAICLVRLGNTEQALHALRPFAQGWYGSYRQREAQALVDQIESARP